MARQLRRRNEEVGLDALSAMADTGRLNTILEPIACWHIKLLQPVWEGEEKGRV